MRFGYKDLVRKAGFIYGPAPRAFSLRDLAKVVSAKLN